MLKIARITVEGLERGCFTDSNDPRFSLALESDKQNVKAASHRLVISKNGEALRDSGVIENDELLHLTCSGDRFEPYTRYRCDIEVTDNYGEKACGSIEFETAKLDELWSAKWITDKRVALKNKKVPPIRFKKTFSAKNIVSARLYATALGNYVFTLGNKRVGDVRLAPGWTSYNNQLQYQCYDVSDLISEENTLCAVVSGGWAIGRIGFGSGKGGVYSKRSMLLAELHLNYADGHSDIIASDESWLSAPDKFYLDASIYDGVVYDAGTDESKLEYRGADLTKPKMNMKLLAAYGEPVRPLHELKPVSSHPSKRGGVIYDFGQNLSGVVRIKVKGAEGGERIVIKHTELLRGGEIYTVNLRGAKATLEYICKKGDQEFEPEFTYMGFQYVRVQGIAPEKLEITAISLTSAVKQRGGFECSNADINRLQSNIRWSGMDNFVDIPTDCPQRDERLGWTGDIAMFASTACFNFDMTRFFDKWLLDLNSEQSKNGSLPFVIPAGPMGTFLHLAAGWADCCIFVPWAQYLSCGDLSLLERQYKSMKLFVEGCSKAARGYIKSTPIMFGDWCAPGEVHRQWFAKTPWIATAFFANASATLSKIAGLLGKSDDETKYRELAAKISDAYSRKFTDGKGTLEKPFQTGYVCPLYFDMYSGAVRANMAKNLRDSVVSNGNKLSTGFLGTPFLLFALSDNGYADTAYDLLLQEDCPSWLYEVKCGATSIWERWDGMKPDGTIYLKGDDSDRRDYDPEDQSIECMVSFNHYAYGAVGDWLYRRVAGIEALEGGYKRFAIKPIIGGGLSYAKAWHDCGYGKILSSWRLENGKFEIEIEVPANTVCELTMPNGNEKELGSGKYVFACEMK